MRHEDGTYEKLTLYCVDQDLTPVVEEHWIGSKDAEAYRQREAALQEEEGDVEDLDLGGDRG